MLEKIHKDFDARAKDKKEFLTKLPNGEDIDWKHLFSKRVLKDKFLAGLRELRKLNKDKTISTAEFANKLREGNMETAWDVLKWGLVGAEAYDTTKAVAKWTGGKAKVGGEGLARSGNWIWEKGLKPVGNAVIVKPVVLAGKVAAYPFKLAGKMGVGLKNWLTTTPKK
jgi:hypothetical protein